MRRPPVPGLLATLLASVALACGTSNGQGASSVTATGHDRLPTPSIAATAPAATPPLSAPHAVPAPATSAMIPGPAPTQETAKAVPTEAAPSTTPATPSTSAEPASPTVLGESPVSGGDGFTISARNIDAALRARIEPTSWRAGCPAGLEELRYLELSFWGFDGAARTGELIVHADVVNDIESVFRSLWVARFPIHSMRLVDDFGGDDFASIEANNTSAFNCRFVEGSTRWSNHATGRAIDINPIQNPYVSGGTTSHPASVVHLVRHGGPGVIVEGGPVTAAFDAVGWDWGGRWAEPIDYQHFSATGG